MTTTAAASKPVLMACGHVAVGKTARGNPVCPICVGISAGATVPASSVPILSNRTATCSYCRTVVPSSLALSFFEHVPSRANDSFYCGCRGWN